MCDSQKLIRIDKKLQNDNLYMSHFYVNITVYIFLSGEAYVDVRNRKYRFYAIIEILICASMVVLVIFSIIRANESLSAESGKITIEEFIYPVLELALGVIVLEVCMHLRARSLNEELCLENQRLHAIIASSNSLIFEYYIKTNEFKWYGDSEKIINASERNKSLESLLHPEDWPIILQQLEDAKRDKTYSAEVKLLDEKGKYHMCNCRTTVEKNATGRVRIILGIIQDVDVRQKNEVCKN